MTTEQVARVTFRDVFAIAEFRALWLAQLLSMAGDQLARVALTVLVYDRTRSALLAAITFVASVVPTFVGGVTLAWLADRYPRRGVMIVCDLVRCALVLVMAIRGMPVAVMVVLLFVVTLVGAPFTAARAAVYPDVLVGDKYVVGTAVTLTTNQFAQVIGFAVGGAIAGLLGTSQALVVDAVTFAGSALIVRAWVLNRPAPESLVSANIGRNTGRRGFAARQNGLGSAVRLVFGNPVLRTSMLFGWLAAFYNSPEGVVTPLAHSLGGGATSVGVILAAQALGETFGALVLSRFVAPARRFRLMGPLAIASCSVLLLFAFRPGLIASLVLLCISGFCGAYQIAANAAFVSATPHDRRSQAFGLAQGGMSFGQGMVMIIAGAAAEAMHPSTIIAVCGGIGSLAAVALAGSWSHRAQAVSNELVSIKPSRRYA
ncbi:MAG: MFS transporter [Streptosporangiaceae bacterium]|nr:MFS transporter [Streptosporangiaceae bacterium]